MELRIVGVILGILSSSNRGRNVLCKRVWRAQEQLPVV